jgi:dipeptidyl aminopeptidase/acylaminoacyl peptidase
MHVTGTVGFLRGLGRWIARLVGAGVRGLPGVAVAPLLGAAALFGTAAAAAPAADPATATAATTGAARPAAPPAAVFGTLPRIAHVELSPDGTTLAWAQDGGAKGATVVAFDAATGATRRTFPIGTTGKLRGLAWADDRTLLVDVSIAHEVQGRRREADKYEMYRTIAVDLQGGEPRMLLMQDNRGLVTGATMVAHRTTTPNTVVMSTFDYLIARSNQTIDTRLAKGSRESGWVHKLFAVDVRTGDGRSLDTGTPFTDDWVVDAAGLPVARDEWDHEQKLYTVLGRRDGAWAPLLQLRGGATLSLVGLSPDGKSVLVLGRTTDGTPGQFAKLWALALDGSGRSVVAEDARYDVEGVLRDPYDGRVVGAAVGGPDGRVVWLDPQAQTLHSRIGGAFPGRTVEIRGRSRDAQRVLAHVSSPSHAPVYYLVDLAKRTADIVGEPYPELADVALGRVEPWSYAARDGTKIPSYLTLPPGGGDAGLPLIVLPHGGPESNDAFEFDWLVQFFATRGYVVLQPQFRGSTGYGEAHRLAGYRQWGGLMQDDVTDGVKALVARGLVDPKRVCIVGASYGGFAALAGATLTPELYACAVSINGVADLPSMLGHTRMMGGEDSYALAYWTEHIGSVHDPKVTERSPARLAAQVRAPILLLHGTDDVVVPIAQSEAMARELQRAGKPFTFVKLPSEDHWLSRGETRTRVLEEIEKFVAPHLGAAAAAGTAR